MDRYNQVHVPHTTKDSSRENDKTAIKHHIQKGQEVSPFPTGDLKATRNNQDSMAKTNTNNHGTNLILNSDVDQDTQMFGLHEGSLTYP